MSLVFIAASLITVLKYLDTKQIVWIILSVLAYFLCSLSKETGLAWLGMIPVITYAVKKQSIKQTIITILPFAAAAGLYFLIRLTVMTEATFDEAVNDVINNSLRGDVSAADRYATATKILGMYIKLLIAPLNLSYDYSFNQIPISTWGDWKVLVSLLSYLGLIAAGIYSFFKQKLIAFPIWMFLFFLVLISNFITPVGATAAERFLFGSSLGFCMLVSMGLFWLAQKASKSFLVFGICVSILTLAYSAKTISRVPVWKNNLTLFESGLTSAPNSARAMSHYASALRMNADLMPPNTPQRNTNYEQAVLYYDKALSIYPNYTEAHYNKGVCFMSLGNTAAAEQAFLSTIQIEPSYSGALNNLGVIYFNKQDYSTAKMYFQKTVDADPNNIQAIQNLGAILFNQGNYSEAAPLFERALSLDPNNQQARQNAIKAYRNLGNEQRARELGG